MLIWKRNLTVVTQDRKKKETKVEKNPFVGPKHDMLLTTLYLLIPYIY